MWLLWLLYILHIISRENALCVGKVTIVKGGRMMAKGKIDSLTGLRGFAAIWVIWFHAMGAKSLWFLDNFLRRGYTGVDLFFVLSGFVISYVYADKMMEFSSRRSKDFIRRDL